MDGTLDLALLHRLRFVTRRRRRGGTWGERRSTRRGTGLEFTDYRDYTPGDDPRRVDWNLYARLDRPYVRLYEEEEDLAVAVLLDGSASMGWRPEAAEEGAEGRWPATRRLAAALGALALLGGDALQGALLQGEQAALWGPGRGRGQVPRWQAWCETLTPGGAALASALQDVARRPWRPGLVLLLTDGYDLDGLRAGVRALAQRGHEVVLLHLLTPEELAPSLHGDLRLIDVEDGARREVTVDAAVLAAYRQRLEAWQAELRAHLGQHDGRYVMLRTDLPLRRMLLEDLRVAGVVQ
jgi:uncharacterized protein (DUF58 family)